MWSGQQDNQDPHQEGELPLQDPHQERELPVKDPHQERELPVQTGPEERELPVEPVQWPVRGARREEQNSAQAVQQVQPEEAAVGLQEGVSLPGRPGRLHGQQERLAEQSQGRRQEWRGEDEGQGTGEEQGEQVSPGARVQQEVSRGEVGIMRVSVCVSRSRSKSVTGR